MTIRIPRYTLDGVKDAEVSVHPFTTDDGLGLNLTRFRRAECDDVVLLVHGLTSSSDLFIMPEHRNLASYLLDTGFTDVWAVDFRMSNRFPYDSEPTATPWTTSPPRIIRPRCASSAGTWGTAGCTWWPTAWARCRS